MLNTKRFSKDTKIRLAILLVIGLFVGTAMASGVDCDLHIAQGDRP